PAQPGGDRMDFPIVPPASMVLPAQPGARTDRLEGRADVADTPSRTPLSCAARPASPRPLPPATSPAFRAPPGNLAVLNDEYRSNDRGHAAIPTPRNPPGVGRAMVGTIPCGDRSVSLSWRRWPQSSKTGVPLRRWRGVRASSDGETWDMLTLISQWILIATLGQAPSEAALLKAAPAEVDVAVRVRGLEAARDDLLAMLKEMNPDWGNMAEGALGG